MGRAPCCEKTGLKKGPWTPQEDQILINYVHNHGHSNWRALPKLAGLLRCGKSCRLRWINYLRPDLKRGNFSKEEEDTVIQLHEKLGNRWSAIAAKLPGRTDNEIKNVWHTHIKKKINQRNAFNDQQYIAEPKCGSNSANGSESIIETQQGFESSGYAMSPQPSSCSENSSVTDGSIGKPEATDNVNEINEEYAESWENFPAIDDAFWFENEFVDHSSVESSSTIDELVQMNHFESRDNIWVDQANSGSYFPDMDENMDFWLDIFVKTGGIHELL